MDVDFSLLQNIINDRATAINFVAYIMAALAGQLIYAVRLWLDKQIDCVFDRFRRDPRATAAALLTNLGVIATAALLVPFGQMPISAAIMMGLFQGISADSGINKSARPIWTAEQRAAAGGGVSH